MGIARVKFVSTLLREHSLEGSLSRPSDNVNDEHTDTVDLIGSFPLQNLGFRFLAFLLALRDGLLDSIP